MPKVLFRNMTNLSFIYKKFKSAMFKTILIVATVIAIFFTNLKGKRESAEISENWSSADFFQKPKENGLRNDHEKIIRELDESEPKSKNGFFFLDTTCKEDASLIDVDLPFRKACSIESAIIPHPENDVYLLITCTVKTPASETKNIFFKELLTYPNFKIRFINSEKYLLNTPMRKMNYTKVLKSTKWPRQQASNILRIATLYKFGGFYLDSDVFVLKSLNNLKNFAGAESNSFVNTAIINFSTDTIGREMAVACGEEITNTFNGTRWGQNGPKLITRVLKKRCNASKISEMNEIRCKGFHVYPKSYFYPIPYANYKIIFQSGKMPLVQSTINNSYTLHVWNKFSTGVSLNGSDVPYIKLAEIYCPKIFQAYKKVM